MPPKSTLPKETTRPPRTDEGAVKVSGKKRQQIKEMWLRDGMSARRISMETGISRRACEAICAQLARSVMSDIPAGLTFQERFVTARERRLEAISAEVARFEGEVEALEMKRAAYSDHEFASQYASITALILANRKEASALRQEYTETYAMLPPAEVVAIEVERVRMELRPPEEDKR